MDVPDHVKQDFKAWVKSQPTRPYPDRGQDWFRDNLSLDDVARQDCENLIAEAIDEVSQSEAARAEMAKSLPFPGFGLPLSYMPSKEKRFPILVGVEDWVWQAATLLNREVCMFKFIEELTNKADWWIKVQDPEIAEKWKKEALEMDWGSYRLHGDFTPVMADACIQELRKKADFYQETGLIPIFDYSSCVVKSDQLIPEDLRSALRSAVRVLEDVPEGEKDWHPGTTHKVLDLVHPSLWPLVYGKTPVLLDKRIGVSDALDHCGMGTVIKKPDLIEILPQEHRNTNSRETSLSSLSHKFQWLPCDIALHGSSAKIDSYINNLHPVDHANLYPIIERFIEKALPAWDLIYRWQGEFETQRLTTKNARATCNAQDVCRWECQPWCRPLDDDEEEDRDAPYRPGYKESERGKRDLEWYMRTHHIELPDPVPGDERHFKPSPSNVKSQGFFNGASRLQVIVKLANVHLTPEDPDFKFDVSKELADWYTAPSPGNMDVDDPDSDSFKPVSSEGSPDNSDVSSPGRRPLSLTFSDYHSIYVDNDTTEYEGGSWHTEGMINERICATALYYYDSENVTDCHLDFRTIANKEDFAVSLGYAQSQHYPISRIFAINNVYRDTLQEIGGVLTTNSPSTSESDTRAVFFPNLLQHRVSPFRLADPTKPGHRKILALFLVDPAVPVISTANVPPQQRHWSDRQSNIEQGLAQRLPPELEKMVLDKLEGGAIDLEEAKRIRLELMEERSVKQDDTERDLSWIEWNFCEH